MLIVAEADSTKGVWSSMEEYRPENDGSILAPVLCRTGARRGSYALIAYRGTLPGRHSGTKGMRYFMGAGEAGRAGHSYSLTVYCAFRGMDRCRLAGTILFVH